MDYFLLNMIISFIIGGLWVAVVTLIAEKFGSKLGGLIAGLPSTLLIGLFFIGITNSTNTAIESTSIVPIIGAIVCIFILIFEYLSEINFWMSIVTGLFFWLISALLIVYFKINDFYIGIAIYIIILIISKHFIDKFKIKKEKISKIDFSLKILFFRIIMSGFVISMAVLLTRIGGPLLGGAFTMFPAMFLSTIIISYQAKGVDFARSIMKNALIGTTSTIIYAIAARYFFLHFEIIFGTIFSFIVALTNAYILYKITEIKQKN